LSGVDFSGPAAATFTPAASISPNIQLALDTIKNEAAYFQTSFDTWEFGEPEGNAKIENGKLITTSVNQERASVTLDTLRSDRFAVEFDFRIFDSGPGVCIFETGNEYGGNPSFRAISAAFLQDGRTSLGHYVDPDQFPELVTVENKFNFSESNKAILIILGDQIAAFINGQLAYTALEPAGSFVSSYHNLTASATIGCEFDNYKIWDLSGVDFTASNDIPAAATATAPPTIAAATATPLPTWVAEFAEPILGAIKDRTPDFQDDFSPDDPRGLPRGWFGYEGGPVGMDKMSIIDGMMQVNRSTISNAYFNYKTNYVLQVDVTRPVSCCVEVSLSMTNSGWGRGYSISLDLGNWGICDPNNDCTWKSYRFDQTIQLTIISKDAQAGIYFDGNPVYYFSDPSLAVGFYTVPMIQCWSMSCRLDNVKFWDLNKIPDLP
jgi:hypothetical protein